MKENELWADIHRHWPNAHAVRIENSASFGDPDVNVCYKGVDFWLELKIEVKGSFVIRPTQLAWISKRLQAGANNVFVFTYDNTTMCLSVYNARFMFAPNVLTTLVSNLKVSVDDVAPLCRVHRKEKDAYNILLNEIILYCTSK